MRRTRRIQEQARRLKQKGAPARPTGVAGGGTFAETAPAGYVRLSLRRIQHPAMFTVADVRLAFEQFNVRIVLFCERMVVLAVASEAEAVRCALTFHGWP